MPTLQDILVPARTVCHAPGISKKRLFETIAQIVCGDQSALDYGTVLEKLIAREELGSTALGNGIAIPHCRVGNCPKPLGTLLTLADAIEFDAPDDKPVDLLCVLMVPEQADQAHLDILAEIARLFSQESFCRSLRTARDSTELYQSAIKFSS